MCTKLFFYRQCHTKDNTVPEIKETKLLKKLGGFKTSRTTSMNRFCGKITAVLTERQLLIYYLLIYYF